MKPDPDTGSSEAGRSAAVEQLLAARGPHLMRAAVALAADGWRRRGVVRRRQPLVAAPEGRADGTDAVDIRDARQAARAGHRDGPGSSLSRPVRSSSRVRGEGGRLSMSIDLEDLLRQGIDRLPAEVPAGLTRRAARRARRRRLVAGAGVVGTAVAALTAAAIAIGTAGGAPVPSRRTGPAVAQPARSAPARSAPARSAPAQHPRPLPSWPPGPVTHATLLSRVEQSVLTSRNYIAYTRRYDYNHRSRLIVSAWDYQNMHLLVHPAPQHQAQLVINYRDRETDKMVFYDSRKWELTTFSVERDRPHGQESVHRPRR